MTSVCQAWPARELGEGRAERADIRRPSEPAARPPLSAAQARVGEGSAMTNRRKVYIDGPQGIKVPASEINLTNGESVRLYDTSGPGSDVSKGLPPLRRDWIVGRADVETYDGRSTQLRDDGRAAVRRGTEAGAFVRT